MENKKISYYELLGMIKEGNIPKKLYVKLPQVSYGSTYIATTDLDEGFSYYERESDKDGEVNYRDYLGECFLESDMFNECIEILEDKKEFEDIEECFAGVELEYKKNSLEYKINQLIRNQKKIIERLENERY